MTEEAKPRSQKRKRPLVVAFRVTADEMALINNAAKEKGMSRAEMCRYYALFVGELHRGSDD